MTYTVKANDTVEGVAVLFYGDKYKPLLDDICSRNRSVIGYDCNRIVPGQVLSIALIDPLADNVALVRTGDNLEVIARAFYDQPALSKLIYEYNKEHNEDDIGEDPNTLSPGFTVILPPDVLFATRYDGRPNDTLQSI